MNEGERADALAQKILKLSRDTLLVNLRFLDAALNRLSWICTPGETLMTEGSHIFYGPAHVLSSYKSEKELPVRDYLHMVLHCVFRHMYINPSLNRSYWDLACDIAVEYAITELGLKSLTTARDRLQAAYIATVKHDLKHVTAEKIYAYLRQMEPDPMRIREIQTYFCADNHAVWYMTAREICSRFAPAGSCKQSGSDAQAGGAAGADMAAEWKTISERMQLELTAFGKQRGLHPGSMLQNLTAVNRERYDYTAFLKKFAALGEAMRINDDEFDYIFYTYGLRLFKNMPLIEPLEYKQIKAIREFAIAIDTSGSTSGESVQRFIQKTYNILQSAESFFTKINVHIIQCDADIQEDVKITSREGFDDYLKTMRIRGGGGTDFRPVFSYVDALRSEKEFTNLKGLIYFTDGYGTFPAKKPDYEVAFVFIDDDYNDPEMPPWAIKLVLQRDEI